MNSWIVAVCCCLTISYFSESLDDDADGGVLFDVFLTVFDETLRLYLIGGYWSILYFSIQLGMSSSQLTHIFRRGRLNHQPDGN